MPELPEVETIRRGLAAHIAGRSVASVHVHHPRPVRGQVGGPVAFEAEVTGRTFDIPARRGKFLWLPFTDGDALLVQLRMSGQFRLEDPSTEPHRHTRITFRLDDGRDLRYIDQRMLGGVDVSVGGAVLPPEIAHIARDPFDPLYDIHAVAHDAHRRSSPIKSVLLNQRIVSGIGNIYADESLWRARMHYARPAASLEPRDIAALLDTAAEVMGEALERGGTTFDGLYVNVNGDSGYFARDLDVYGREGEPCDRCGALIVREPFMNRSSYFCPRCQRRPRR